MQRPLKIVFIVLGIVVALLLLFTIILYIAGGQSVTDPFVSGIDVIDAPYTAPGTVTWRLVDVPEGTESVLYISSVSRPAADGFAPQALGYNQSIKPRMETADGVTLYKADVPAGSAYVRVYADINGPKWSQEFHMEAS